MIVDAQLRFKLKLFSLLAMIMVVFIHAYTLEVNGYAGALSTERNYNTFIQDLISQGITRVACPIFFTISGLLLFARFELRATVVLANYRKRIRSLLIPFLLWSALSIGMYYLLQLSPAFRPYFRNHLIDEMTTRELLSTLLLSPIPYQLWFLRDLMVLVLISPVVWVLVKYFKVLLPCLALVAWVADLDLVMFTSEALLFFSVGCLLVQKPDILYMVRMAAAYRYLLPIWLALLILKTALAYLGYDVMVVFLLLHKTAILTGMAALWSAILALGSTTSGLVNKRWIDHFVSPFFIYAFHEPLLSIFKKAILFVIPVHDPLPALLVYILVPVAVVLVAIVAGQVLKHFAPWLFAVLTGNRDQVPRSAEVRLQPLLSPQTIEKVQMP